MLCSILILITLPLLHYQSIKGLAFYGPVKFFFWSFVVCFCFLTLAGSWVVEPPFVRVSRCLTFFYFSFFPALSLLRWFWDFLLS